MLAIVGAFLAALAGFDVTAGSVSNFDLLCFGVALIGLHLAYPLAVGRRA